MKKILTLYVLIAVMGAGLACRQSGLLMVNKKPQFTYATINSATFYAVPAINYTAEEGLNNAEARFFKLMRERYKASTLVQSAATLKMLRAKGLEQDYSLIRNKFKDTHAPNPKDYQRLRAGGGYLVFFKIMAFSVEREKKSSCLFPDLYKEERALRAQLSGSLTFIDLKTGIAAFDAVHTAQYVYNQGTTDSPYRRAHDRQTLIDLCLQRFFSTIIGYLPNENDVNQAIDADASKHKEGFLEVR